MKKQSKRYQPLISCDSCAIPTRHGFDHSSHGQLIRFGKECKDPFAWFHNYKCQSCGAIRIYGASTAKPDHDGVLDA